MNILQKHNQLNDEYEKICTVQKQQAALQLQEKYPKLNFNSLQLFKMIEFAERNDVLTFGIFFLGVCVFFWEFVFF